jgi:hypothetical protein
MTGVYWRGLGNGWRPPTLYSLFYFRNIRPKQEQAGGGCHPLLDGPALQLELPATTAAAVSI